MPPILLLFIITNLIHPDKKTFEINSTPDLVESKTIFIYDNDEWVWKSSPENRDLAGLIFSVNKKRLSITLYQENGRGGVIPFKDFLEFNGNENWDKIAEIKLKKIYNQKQKSLKIKRSENELILKQEKGIFEEYGEIKVKF